MPKYSLYQSKLSHNTTIFHSSESIGINEPLYIKVGVNIHSDERNYKVLLCFLSQEDHELSSFDQNLIEFSIEQIKLSSDLIAKNSKLRKQLISQEHKFESFSEALKNSLKSRKFI